MDAIDIRRAELMDARALAELAERTFTETFAADNQAADMAEYCATAFSPEVQGGQIADPSIDTFVVTDRGGVLIGYAQLRSGAPPEVTVASPIELWRFYVDRGHHGRGVAQGLMSTVVEAARAREARTLWLGVWERNFRALAFYKKAGFIDVGAHEFRLGNDVQTDRLMARSID